MSTGLTYSLQVFIQKLEGLKDWPDKNVILELTEIAEKNIGFAEHFAKIVMARLTNEQTHSSYKLPMFYVIDAIMKHVGGPFANLFSGLFSDGYVRALFDLHEKDRAKLKFLLDTWDERSFLSFDLIRRMKQLLDTPSANRPVVQPYVSNQAVPVSAPIVPAPVYNRPKPAPTAFAPQAAVPKFQPANQPRPADFTGSRPPIAPTAATSADPSVPGMFADLVQNEMVTMLNQMYAEMNVTNPMSLDELSRANPSLFQQIKGKAEEMARVVMAKRKFASTATASSSSPQQQRGAAPHSYPMDSPRGYPMGQDMTGHKRTAPFQQQQQRPAYNNNAPYNSAATSAAHSGPGASNYYPNQAAPAGGYQQYTSRFNPPRPRTYPTAQGPGPQGGGYPRRDQEAIGGFAPHDTRRLAAAAAAAGVGTGTGIGGQDISRDFDGAADPALRAAELAAEAEEQRLREEIMAKYASDYFVNGFLCEVPVVLDVARIQSLREVLNDQYVCSEEAKAAATGVQTEHKLSEGFLAASASVSKRLDAYLRDIQVPPRLPQILFGPLPLRPIFAPSAEAQEELASKNKARDAAAAEKPQVKLPVPPFRTEELGRNPEKMVAALYGDKPHQFHEDGLRFSSLSLLMAHSDKFLELKKMLQKRKEVREYREWYCRTSQWVTDFSALGVSGSGSGGGGGGAANTGGNSNSNNNMNNNNNNNADNEEYLVPADEYFTRCPISRETFECLWDDQEGEMMYRNAVKVLLTEAADPALFALAQPVPWEDTNAVKYLIVHKLLVLDAWLSSGKAVPLQDALIRYKTIGAAGQGKADKLQSAVGDDDDEEDLFVLLEFN